MSPPDDPQDVLGWLPRRAGEPPGTNTPAIPHAQLDQFPEDAGVGRALASGVFGLPFVEERPSVISVPGARALWLTAGAGPAPPHVFIREREFAHVHPDLSLHLVLPREEVEAVIAAGWGEWHPWALDGRAGAWVVLVFAPRDLGEVEIVARIVRCSWRHAIAHSTGQPTGA